ncbi:transposase [Streptomyces altiplanensis]
MLFDAHRDDPEFGYRFLAGEAEAVGERMCERTAWRICRDNAWWSVFGKKRAKNGKRSGPLVHDDLVRRDFTAGAVNELWLTDITEHTTGEGKVYLYAVKDACSGRIAEYSIGSRMQARLAVNALNNAVGHRGDVAGCVVHSDRGSQEVCRQAVRRTVCPARRTSLPDWQFDRTSRRSVPGSGRRHQQPRHRPPPPQTPAGSPAADLGVTSDVVFLRAVPAWETEAL